MSEPSRYISGNVSQLKPSGIRKFFDLAANMEGVISLGVGEPDFITSWNVREACIQSLEQGYTAYTANAGMLELRKEICSYLNSRFALNYDASSEVMVTVGASQALDLSLRAILNPGEEVLLIEPCFVSYEPLIRLCGGIPVSVSAREENSFKPTAADIEKKITQKTKALILCSPNNPTGAQLTKKELQEVSLLAEKHDLLVIADEIYAELSYEEAYTSFSSLPGMRERTILVSGFSKGFAMTGWRLGYACAPAPLLAAMLKIHQYSMMCAPTMAQHAALEALTNGLADVDSMKRSYRQRRNLFVEGLREIGFSCHLPGGAFYAFPSIKNTGLSSDEYAESLLLEEKVAVVPGSVFGSCGEGFVRCSYASSVEQLQEALKRMERHLKKLQASSNIVSERMRKEA
ncbi:aminotransferase [Bacillus lacus]|uniref:Aminotransferase n=1 Tax=Metabacillus lacus TaxID=1983721 RepID=A0A7X2J191_9BACI|nr:aminotransferase [Metabacillus lacus]MRX73593.1 aminotransferase [Metabacillus lacus]